jgi:integrase
MDQGAWQAAMAVGDRFDGGGSASRWTEASKYSIRSAYGRWLSFLAQSQAHLLEQSPDGRLTPQILSDYVRQLQLEVRASTVKIYIDHLHCALKAMAPSHDWRWLKYIVRRLERKVAPRSKRNRVIESNRLYDLGFSLMEQAEASTADNLLNNAILYRDGLLIAILAARPMRRRTLSRIRIDQHLCRVGERYGLIFSPEDTKNRQPLEFYLPLDLTTSIDRYLAYFRRNFPRADEHNGLWASAKGFPMSVSSLYRRIISRTEQAFGFPINPHLFRDCAATTLATYKPDQVLTGAGLLGHSDLRTIHKHYIHAQTMQAARAHQQTMDELRLRLAKQRSGR